jgi:hypothetical protein
MIECRYCGEMFYADPDRLGARCRRCREPLYERRDAGRDANEPVPSGQCATHPRSAAAGACQRCGTFMCAVCRTRWQERSLCPACVLRAMDEKEVRPEDVKAHRRQALLAVVFGVSAWAMTLLGGLLLAVRGTTPTQPLIILASLLCLAAFLPAFFGIGQGAAAVRARGNRLILATFGLALSAAHVGLVFGLTLLALWKT